MDHRNDHILSPSQLNTLARDLLEGAFPLVLVEGEIGNLSRPGSGHLYFTLKDARAQVRCALFKPKSQWLNFAPREGLRVLARGRLTLYEARGDYQLILDSMEEAGEGALRRAFEELKARLQAEGLFDAARKRPLPAHVRRLAVLTSASGAVIRDIVSVLRRRFPLLEVELLPVPVQGDAAAAQIRAMLQRAIASARYDVMLLARGGGSLEDLWAFNDEALVRAIAASPVPVVSAIGHETDFTLADFAADLRAPTPSAAAELLVPDRANLLARLHGLHRQLQSQQGNALRHARNASTAPSCACTHCARRRAWTPWRVAASRPSCGWPMRCSAGWSRNAHACAMRMRCCGRRIHAAASTACANACRRCADARNRCSPATCSTRRCACAGWRGRCMRSARWPRSRAVTASCSAKTAAWSAASATPTRAKRCSARLHDGRLRLRVEGTESGS
jgi:exodeoxyribonuclease VII large subunit